MPLFFRFIQSHKDFKVSLLELFEVSLGPHHMQIWCFPNFLGLKVNNFITRGLGQPSFGRDCIVGQPTVACQTLDHSECLQMLSPEEAAGPSI